MSDLLTRRSILAIAAGAGASRAFAFGSDFWNKKDPSEWSHDEIQQLTTKSPWAKEVSASAPVQGGYGNGGGGYPGGGYPGGGYPGGGYPGGGGMGRRGGMGRGPMSQSIRGTVRWESAKPIIDAIKPEFPKEFENRYVISVSGFPLNGGQRGQRQSEDDDSAQSRQDQLDRLKQVTFLEPKNRRDAQPGVVRQPVSASYGTIWFGFDRDFLNLKEDDKEVTFETQLGRMSIKTKFNLKDMLYHGQLAL